MKDQIRSWVLNVLSGRCFSERRPSYPKIFILSPWIGDVQLEIDKEVRELDKYWFGTVYRIGCINLPYALLTLKLDFGADIDIVTLPPTEKHYHEKTSSARILLDFLDEIGCNVYVNPDLRSKLILSNDMALLGSFNLLFSALWSREEVGVCIDDVENLKILERYANEVIASSEPYGYTVQARGQESTLKNKTPKEMFTIIDKRGYVREDEEKSITERFLKPIDSVTRGWLFEKIIHEQSDLVTACGGFTYACHEFLYWHLRPSSVLSYDMIKLASSNLEAFYINILLAFLKSQPKERLGFLEHLFNYQGKNEVGEILDFLTTKFARTHVPKISHIIISLPKQE